MQPSTMSTAEQNPATDPAAGAKPMAPVRLLAVGYFYGSVFVDGRLVVLCLTGSGAATTG